MLGKASEIKVKEMKISEFSGWATKNPNTEISDIKYGVSPDSWSYILIIYKEAPHE
ncbi:hypothetical protein QYF50_18845 [Paenibacillus vini]|uniref:hypothetical protein n=1 Tax=Paenibacillus vini TaxID=1476024 RepID=UPI0025B66286|nr:hypothetical protein [Paenibacillus vini]MDN4069964.1 hypothetical protein [Paenibacillus vini]